MRQQRTQRMSMPAPVSTATTGLQTSGYSLIVDGQAKVDFKTRDQALKAARDLKGRFPRLEVKVYDVETRQSEKIELAAP